uniref:Uncharacterized protein n=1 Tax=Triticum urartu TaxID=4572 RepID=A0A8R7QXT1_TRIUA
MYKIVFSNISCLTFNSHILTLIRTALVPTMVLYHWTAPGHCNSVVVFQCMVR